MIFLSFNLANFFVQLFQLLENSPFLLFYVSYFWLMILLIHLYITIYKY